MVRETLRLLAVQPGGRYVDCTVGGGGHAEAILEAASPGGLLLGIDADPGAIETAGRRLERFRSDARLVEGNFRDLAAVCRDFNFVPVHGVLFDLGVSSLQLGEATRGFSFQAEAPLDMRFGDKQALTAADIVNRYEEKELADLIWRYGEERHSRRIAQAIIKARPVRTTTQLAEVIAAGVPGRRHRPGRIHPATLTFQALRIAVNDELENLAQGLEQALEVLGPGGRLAVIAFHSLEDRMVKQFIQREARDCICPPRTPACVCGHRATLRPVSKGALRPSPEEVNANPRARSARLRAAEKL
ncbi:MAG: 16S rRNA (cytosine(1402)-N(4))-methyltransferase RsmH [Chloroflexi bacterium]|nr:16S rRNA (cytosine(1402)-N(4))-methyltransferase RsmH [Chloroflexota bacterium]